ncbi:alpha/beta hydrolase [Lactiplantibacillus plantarum]|uniref:alpha/beta hydrolase n=1 Tax=Lactiplantibacillus plantarum TaxID=1590 RepID=UPI0005FB7BA9|nr:alpha/beta hydrolase [Lactiplantibacillus plantarum]ALG26551.1 hydrolase [Lactiplantibacillus plantarum]MBO2727109.1 alpha/beta hydrolase [Lactiplantibacillus plantarum]MCG0570489.1 putative cell surface hydrolase, membrane-bound (putative) [Lactiplantibacillus plantarum]MCG0673125.1 putative cell surface hydrolase, membrane-bound (putative) [Lactiplantibacillus plantarum]MCG0781324.1 putative cell surface hydrolase, membrane-bound (putative) [Lactiplantibacillus plantarum]
MAEVILVIIGVLVLGILGRITFKFWQYGRPQHLRQSVSANSADDSAVTLFIPGYAGNRFSFGGMLQRFTAGGIANKSLVVMIDRHNHPHVTGELDAYRPMVQLIFATPRVAVRQQAAGVLAVVQYLIAHEHVQTINLVAHSMGGVVLFQYLTTAAKLVNLPEVRKVVTIGAPFNDSEVGQNTYPIENHPLTATGPTKTTPVYNYFLRTLQRLPNTISYLNIAGNIGDAAQSDGAVALNSALSLRFLLRPTRDQYQEFVVHGKNARHSRLHENYEVDRQIVQFLYPEVTKKVAGEK